MSFKLTLTTHSLVICAVFSIVLSCNSVRGELGEKKAASEGNEREGKKGWPIK